MLRLTFRLLSIFVMYLEKYFNPISLTKTLLNMVSTNHGVNYYTLIKNAKR